MRRLFGTDGIRGVANKELTCELAYRVGRALATVLSNRHRYRPIVLVGMDTRISSDMLANSISAGLCSVGADVIYLGVVPTPAVAYLVGKYKARGGVMISASHNSYEFNGIKIFSENGFKLPDALEEEIEDLVLERYESITSAASHEIGRVTYADHALEDYISHIKTTALFGLQGMHIALDCSNGSSSVTAERLFTELGATCDVLAASPDGHNINAACGSTHMEALIEYVKTHDVDAGVAFDGDADRCLCVDERGNVVDGDMIMAITALDMKTRGKLAKNTVVGTVMSNFGFGKFCRDNEIRMIAAKVGDRYVLEEMIAEGYCLGGEQSGHVIFYDFSTTGDGQLTAVQLLSQMKRTGKKLSELASVMKKYPQTMVNIKVSAEGKIGFYTDDDVKKILQEASERIGANGRVLIRPSGTEPLIRVMVEGEDLAEIEALAQETSQRIAACLERY